MTGYLTMSKSMKDEEYISSKFTRDKKLYELYRNWHNSYFKTEPSSQQIIVCCEFASYLLENPPQTDA